MGGNYSGGMKKSKHVPVSPQVSKNTQAPAVSKTGNLALSAAMGISQNTGRSIDELGESLRQRMRGVQERAQSQIPQAENEADRISSAITMGTPESVKAMMGRRMGADFSGVRFHTGAAAAAKADAMGARAYTSGADVYFGSEGFDPSVAAHELVHTAQQGMVDSSMSVMSTPVGGVQMVENGGTQEKKKKARDGWFKEHTWGKTGGRMIRKHHDAIDELHEAMQSGDWNELSMRDRLSWKMRNPLAYRRYMKQFNAKKNAKPGEKVDDSLIQSADARITKKKAQEDAARAYLEKNQSQMGPSSMITTDENNELILGHGTADKMGAYINPHTSLFGHVEKGGDVFDKLAGTPLGIAGSVAETAEASDKVIGGIGGSAGAAGILTGGVSGLSHIKDIYSSAKDGDWRGVGKGAVDLTSDISSVGGGVSSLAKGIAKAGSTAADIAGDAAAGFGLVNGAIDIGTGSYDMIQGSKQSIKMAMYKKQNFGDKDRKDLATRDLFLRDVATQGKMEGTRRAVQGAGKVVTGALDAAASGMELGGVTAGAGLGVSGLSLVTKAGMSAVDHQMKNRIKKKVTAQTTGITNEEIRKFQEESGIKSFSRAKQAMMKAKGYSTGQRAELVADQTQKRGELLAQMTGVSGAYGEKARGLAEGLGVKQAKDGSYDSARIAKALGYDKSREEIASKSNRIAAYAQMRRAKKNASP